MHNICYTLLLCNTFVSQLIAQYAHVKNKIDYLLFMSPTTYFLVDRFGGIWDPDYSRLKVDIPLCIKFL